MKNFYFKQFVILLLANTILALIALLIEYLTSSFFYSIWSVFLFFFLSTYLVICLILIVRNFFKDYVGFAFMGLVLIKGLASIIFLIPSFINEPKPDFSDLILFFIPYFIFLAYEAFFSIQLINSSRQND